VKLIRNIKELDGQFPGCALTIGNFDGVHLGHARIIGRLRAWADQVEGPAVVLTFDPHPVRLLRPQLTPPPLTWTRRKAELLSDLGVDGMIAWPTDRALLGLSSHEFFQQVILETMGAAAIVEGPNFHFGKDREGDVQRLRELCEQAGIHCEIVTPGINGGELISSTRIRNLIREGDMLAARQMLTQPYRIRGMVVHGDGRGTEIGFPTANLDAIDTLIPAMGVYAGVAVVERQPYMAAVHIGPSPTFGVERPTVEVHLLDFDESVYGSVIEVDFLESLRGIRHFGTAADLQSQLQRDIERTRQIASRYLQEPHIQPTPES
jgi:riboflavin kinase/FMN adenylyltransferase